MRDFVLPDIGEGLVEAEVVSWLVAEGDVVGLDDPLVEVETDKTVVVIPAPVGGIVVRHGAPAGETLGVGAILAVIDDGSGPVEPVDRAPGSVEEDPPIVGTFGAAAETLTPRIDVVAQGEPKILVLPLVRKLARDQGIDLAGLSGSGPGGRITRADIMEAIERKADLAVPIDAPDKVPNHAPAEPLDVVADSDVIQMSKLRRTIADRMSQSWAEVPRVTTFDDVDATRLLEARKALSLRHGQAVTLEALVVKAVVPVLAEFPEFNATVDGDRLILHRRPNIAVAVDTPNGLMVPVIHDAGDHSVLEIASEIGRLSKGATDRNLAPDEVTGGTFTVSNIGAVGGGHGTPIVPSGTTAILSVGRAKDTPVARDGAVVIAPMMPLSLSYDHRAIDGALGRKFMARLMENLAEPTLFLV